MSGKELRVSAFTASRAMAFMLGAVALLFALWSWEAGACHPLTGQRGLTLASPDTWIAPGSRAALAAGLAALLATAALMVAVNRAYNLLRSYSLTFAGLFMLMSAATPSAGVLFQGGLLLAPVMMLDMTLMLSVYRRPDRTPRVFLAFMLLSAGAMVQYGFVMYIPVLFMGLAQMRVFDSRAITAALLGLATPWFVYWAFGPGLWPRLRMPDFAGIFDVMPPAAAVHFLVSVGATLLTGLAIGLSNLFKLLSYNAKARAFNGFLTVTTIMTMAMAIVDITNVGFYTVLLNACTAFQAGHFFAINLHRRGYLLPLALTLLYTGLWIWGLTL